MMTATQLRLDYGITASEIDSMMPFQYEMTKMMIVDILNKKAKQ